MFGELLPQGGGDPIPLFKRTLLVGRRESCDIVLRFPNVSAHHCQLNCNGGYWYVRDLKSRNGVKVNGVRVTDKRLDPGDVLSIAKHNYDVKYAPVEIGAVGPPPEEVPGHEVFGKSLLERAGLKKKQVDNLSDEPAPDKQAHYRAADDPSGQIGRGEDSS